MNLTPPIAIKLDDDKAEQVNRSHTEKIKELQTGLLAGAVIASATLANGVTTPVPHKLGRRPAVILQGVLRTAGVSAGTVVEVSRDDKVVNLQANGFGAAVTMDLVIA